MSTITTAILAVNPAQPEAEIVEYAAALIRSGVLVAFPTETVYGLGANALDADAVRRIFAAKGRPAHDPLIVHVASVEQARLLCGEVSPVAEELMARFWPGALTLVLPRSPLVPDEVTAGGDTVAVRAPSHPLAQALIRAADRPIAAPSANLFGHTSPTTAQHVWDDLAGRIELILDGGPTPIGVESTVLDLSGDTPTILRHGGVTVEQLRAVLGEVSTRARGGESAVLLSPGLLDRHYAPHTPLLLLQGNPERARAQLAERALQEVRAGQRIVLLAFAEDMALLASVLDGESSDTNAQIVSLGSLYDLEGVARGLYDALRRADASYADLILAREPDGAGVGAAIRDRLARAAHMRVQTG